MATEIKETKTELMTTITQLQDENKLLTNKNYQLENMCKSYVKRAQKAEAALLNATRDYNLRIKYAEDAVKHAYTSIHFVNKGTITPEITMTNEEDNNND